MDNSKTVKRASLPSREADLVDVAKAVAAKWKTVAAFTLQWTNPEEFTNNITQFENSFSIGQKTRGNRSILSQELRSINKEINGNLQYVKNYIAIEYGKTAATAHYPSFGITKSGKTYIIAIDHDKRLAALKQLADAIATAPFASGEYGKDYWTDVLVRFEKVFQSANLEDATKASHTGIKSELRPLIRQTLNSLIMLIKANYPHTWKQELRSWGFMKEKY